MNGTWIVLILDDPIRIFKKINKYTLHRPSSPQTRVFPIHLCAPCTFLLHLFFFFLPLPPFSFLLFLHCQYISIKTIKTIYVHNYTMFITKILVETLRHTNTIYSFQNKRINEFYNSGLIRWSYRISSRNDIAMRVINFCRAVMMAIESISTRYTSRTAPMYISIDLSMLIYIYIYIL